MVADDRGQAPKQGVKGAVACLVPSGAQPQLDAWRKFLCVMLA